MNYSSADCSTSRKSYICVKSPSQWYYTLYIARGFHSVSALCGIVYTNQFYSLKSTSKQYSVVRNKSNISTSYGVIQSFPYSREPALNIATSMFTKMRFPLWERNRRQSQKTRYSRREKIDQDSFNSNNGENYK